MASPNSILKKILNINHNRIHIIYYETKTVTINRFGETIEQLQVHVHARPYKHAQGRCPICGKKCPGYDHKRNTESKWRAPNLNGVPVFICYSPQRIECPEHGVLTENIPWADGDSRFTPEFNDEIAWMVCRMSKSDISLYENINWRTVGNCVSASQKRLDPDPSDRLRNLHKICVDETSYKKGFSYITVVYDMERNNTVWIHKGHGLEVFKLFCESLTEEEQQNIEIVAGDGARWIDTCVEKYFPNATRCIDFFHVSEWANEKLDKVRTNVAAKAHREYEKKMKEFQKAEEEVRNAKAELAEMPKRGRPSKRKLELLKFLEEQRSATITDEDTSPKRGRPRKEKFDADHQEELDRLKNEVKAVKGAKHALGHRPENCTEYQKERIKLIENSYPDLYKAYQQKESLRLILHLNDVELATSELDKWIKDAAESELTPIQELSEKILRHKDNILNSIRHKANSAKSEAVNTTIKVLIKMARGFRNIQNLIDLIYLKCSDIVIPLNNRPQMSAEKAAAKRKAANERRKLRQLNPVSV